MLLQNKYLCSSQKRKKNTIVLSFISLAYLFVIPDKSDSDHSPTRVYLSERMHACGAYFWVAVSREYNGVTRIVLSFMIYQRDRKQDIEKLIVFAILCPSAALSVSYTYIRVRENILITRSYDISSLDVTLQVQQGSGGPPTSGLQGVGVPVSQQGMFMAQGGVGGRATGFPVGGMGSSALQGPLAYLEKTTSNIGMPERRS